MTDAELKARMDGFKLEQRRLCETLGLVLGTLEIVRDQQREMLGWMNKKPSSDLPDALRKLAAAVTDMHAGIVALGRDLPGMVADELRLKGG